MSRVAAANLIRRSFASEHHIAPVSFVNDTLIVGAESDTPFLKERIRRHTRVQDVVIKSIPPFQLAEAISTAFPADQVPTELQDDRLLDAIAIARDRFAEEIIIAPHAFTDEQRGRRVIGGRIEIMVDEQIVVHSEIRDPRQFARLHHAVASKAFGTYDPRESQRGRISPIIDGGEINFRVRSAPAYEGESSGLDAGNNDEGFTTALYMRLLPTHELTPSFAHFDLMGERYERYIEAMSRANAGAVFAGQPGSGKTSLQNRTLMSPALEGRHIIVLEQPVEVPIPGIRKFRIDDEHFTFEDAHATTLQVHPHFIVVGEALNALLAKLALVGLSTGVPGMMGVHANATTGIPKRLRRLGISGNEIIDAFTVFVAPRLLPRLCPTCSLKNRPVSDRMKKIAGLHPAAAAMLKQAIKNGVSARGEDRNCPVCLGTGTSGKVAVVEFFELDRRLRDAIRADATEDELDDILRAKRVERLIDRAIYPFAHNLVAESDIFRMLAPSTVERDALRPRRLIHAIKRQQLTPELARGIA